MFEILITQLLLLVGTLDPVNQFDHTSWMAVVTPADRLKAAVLQTLTYFVDILLSPAFAKAWGH